MKVMTKIGLASVGLAGVVLAAREIMRRRRVQSLEEDFTGEDLGDFGDAIIEEVEIIGIAPVDPQPMTQIAGEGIDLEANAAAHKPIR